MRSKKVQVQCCQCNRVRREGRWSVLPNIIPGAMHYSHGYCPRCLSHAMEAIHEHYKEKHLQWTR